MGVARDRAQQKQSSSRWDIEWVAAAELLTASTTETGLEPCAVSEQQTPVAARSSVRAARNTTTMRWQRAADCSPRINAGAQPRWRGRIGRWRGVRSWPQSQGVSSATTLRF